ncbi:hypothetical protein QA597_10675 [Marinilabiliaceae bacterium ANBcel2]|nr:hypothetical protein [Marinilabiliaceae bacterium ANBcel2]
MKINKPHIIKRNYKKPSIEEFELDRSMSLMMGSPPDDPDEDDEVENPPGPENSPLYNNSYKPKDNPFGGSRPAW